jgi:hypothetical protein
MPQLTLPVHSLVYLQDPARLGLTTAQTAPVDGFLTEHNRAAPSISTTIIGNNKRTITGSMRNYTVATKKSFSFSWAMVPADYAHTADGLLVPTSNVIYGMGGNDMLNFYEAYYNKSIYLNTAGERYRVLITEFSYDIIKRNVKTSPSLSATDLWNVNLGLEEV